MIFRAYVIRSTATPKVYIGITKRNLADRWQDHKEAYLSDRSARIYAAMRKYGIATFSIEELANAQTVADISEVERLLIVQFDSFRNGYNCTTGGASGYQLDVPDSTREKMRIAQTGKKQSPELIAKRVRTTQERHGSNTAHMNIPEIIAKRIAATKANHGYDWAPERHARMSNHFKGRVFTPEWKAKISAAKKGVKMTPGLKRKKGYKMPPRSPEHIAKLSFRKRKRIGPLMPHGAFFSAHRSCRGSSAASGAPDGIKPNGAGSGHCPLTVAFHDRCQLTHMKVDPPLIGPDPVWACVRSGKGHCYYALAGILLLSVVVARRSPRAAALTAGLACGCIADLWAHLYQH
jgi:group I intron endonuclease